MARSDINSLDDGGSGRMSYGDPTWSDVVNGHLLQINHGGIRAMLMINAAAVTRTVRLRNGTDTVGLITGDSYDHTFSIPAASGSTVNMRLQVLTAGGLLVPSLLGGQPFVDVSGADVIMVQF